MSEIRTVEELAALPAGSVLRKPSGQVVWLALREGRVVFRYWSEWAALDRAITHLPLTLLYRPDWPSQADLHAAVDAVRELIDPAAAMALNDATGRRWFDEADIRVALDATPTEEDK